MATDRIIQIADALLQSAVTKGIDLVLVHSCGKAVAHIDPKPSQNEIGVAARWLVDLGLATAQGKAGERTGISEWAMSKGLASGHSDSGAYNISAPGFKVAGHLAEFVAAKEETERAAHKANIAAVDGVEKSQTWAKRAFIVSVIALVIAAVQAFND